jgi:hypothetical protein
MNKDREHYDPYGYHLQALVCNAGLNADLQRRLLNGQRRQVSVSLGLSDRDLATVTEIRASTLEDFALKLPGVHSVDAY